MSLRTFEQGLSRSVLDGNGRIAIRPIFPEWVMCTFHQDFLILHVSVLRYTYWVESFNHQLLLCYVPIGPGCVVFDGPGLVVFDGPGCIV